jgi:outer membrane protein TolC
MAAGGSDPGWTKQFKQPANGNEGKDAVQPVSVPPEAGVTLDAELSLPDLVRLSLSMNPATRTAWHRAREMAARADTAKAADYPTVNVGVTVKGKNEFFNTMSYGMWSQAVYAEPYIAVTYLIFDFGKTEGDIKAADQQRLAAECGFNAEFQGAVYGMEKAYFEYQMARQAIDASLVNMKLAEALDDSAAAALANGLGTVESAADAKRIRARAAYELEKLQNAGKVALGEVSLQAGLPGNYPLKVARPQEWKESLPLTDGVDRLISTALVYKPEMSSKYARVREEEARASAARAELYPSVFTGAFLGAPFTHYWGESSGNTVSYNQIYPDFGASITLNYELFDGSARKNRLAAAEAAAKSAREELALERIRTVRGAWIAYYRYMTAREHVKFASQLADTARTARDSAAEGFKNGLSTVVELLAAERDLAEAEMIRTNSVAELFIASSQIALSTGTISGVQPPHP